MNKLLLFAGFCLAVGAANASHDISTNDFFRYAEFKSATLSPDGRYAAVSFEKGSSTLAAVINLKTKAVAHGISLRENRHVFGLQWIGPERFVFRIARKLGFFDFPVSFGTLHSMKADGSRYRDVSPGGLRVGKSGSSALGGWVSIVSQLLHEPNEVIIRVGGAYPKIFKVNAETDRVDRLFLNPLRYGYPIYNPYGQLIAVSGVDDDSHDSVIVVPDGEGWHEVSRTSGERKYDYPVGEYDGRLIFISDSHTDTKALVAVDMDSGEREVLFSDPSFDVSGVVPSSDRTALLAVQYQGEYPETRLLNSDHPEAVHIAKLLATFPEDRVNVSSFVDDGRYALVQVSSDRNPGQFYRYDANSERLEFMFDTRPWIKAKQMAERSPIKFRARDGKTVHGYLTLPNGGLAKDLPMVVIPHGGPHGVRDTWSFDSEAQFLAHHGYAVLQINFRGSGGYGAAFQNAGYKRWGLEMIDDLTDGVHEVVKAGIADPDRLCIYGASYGGYSAMMSVVREPDLYRCAVGYVGVYDLNLMFDRGDVQSYPEGEDYLTRAIGEDEEHNRLQSPAEHADKIKAEVFLVHGKLDYRAHYDHYKKMAKALKTEGKPFESLVQPKEAHGFYDLENRIELYDRMLAFLDKHTGTSR